MFKGLLRLLAASASFVALLLIANPAIAATTSMTTFDHQLSSPLVSLNVVSPSWQLVSEDSLLNHLGCTCNVCLQSLEQNTRQI